MPDCSLLQHSGRAAIPTGHQRECCRPSAGKAALPIMHLTPPPPATSPPVFQPHPRPTRPSAARRRRSLHHHDDHLSDVHVGRTPAAAAALSSADAGTSGAALSAASASASAASSTALRYERTAAACAPLDASAGSPAATALFNHGRGTRATSSRQPRHAARGAVERASAHRLDLRVGRHGSGCE